MARLAGTELPTNEERINLGEMDGGVEVCKAAETGIDEARAHHSCNGNGVNSMGTEESERKR